MFKLIAFFAVVVCTSGQLIRLNPLTLGSRSAAALQTIQLARTNRLGYAPRLAYARPAAIAAAPLAIAPLGIAAAPIAALPYAGAYLNEGLYAPQPYNYGYTTVDGFGTSVGRQESGNGAGGVTGSYSLAEADGRQRIVEYIADGAGFRATVKTNEPGTANSNPADVLVQSTSPLRR